MGRYYLDVTEANLTQGRVNRPELNGRLFRNTPGTIFLVLGGQLRGYSRREDFDAVHTFEPLKEPKCDNHTLLDDIVKHPVISGYRVYVMYVASTEWIENGPAFPHDIMLVRNPKGTVGIYEGGNVWGFRNPGELITFSCNTDNIRDITMQEWSSYNQRVALRS